MLKLYLIAFTLRYYISKLMLKQFSEQFYSNTLDLSRVMSHMLVQINVSENLMDTRQSNVIESSFNKIVVNSALSNFIGLLFAGTGRIKKF